jgi:hypothetical protein
VNRDDGKRYKLCKKITEEEPRKWSSEGQVEDEVTSFEEVQKKLEGKIEVMENPSFITEARTEGAGAGEGEAEVERGVDANAGEGGNDEVFVVSSSSSPWERDGGSRRCCGPAACGRAGTGTESCYGCLRCSHPRKRFSFFQSYRFSSETEPFSFERAVPRKPKRFFGPRQPSTPHGSPTRQRSTKATANTTPAPPSLPCVQLQLINGRAFP